MTEEVYAEVGHDLRHPGLGIDDVGLLSFRLANGVFGTLDTSWSRPPSYPIWDDVKLDVLGEKGLVSVDAFEQNIHVNSDKVGKTSWVNWGRSGDEGMVADFVAMIREVREPFISGEDGQRARSRAGGLRVGTPRRSGCRLRASNMSRSAAQRAREILESNPLFFDTETTGLGPTDEIVEVGIVDAEGRTLLQGLVRPVSRIPSDVVAVHGITNDMVRDAPTWQEIWHRVKTLFTGRPVGIFNAEFDLRMMRQSHERHGFEGRPMGGNDFCVMKLYARSYGERLGIRNARWQGLQKAGRNPQPQRATRRGRRPPGQPGIPPHGARRAVRLIVLLRRPANADDRALDRLLERTSSSGKRGDSMVGRRTQSGPDPLHLRTGAG